MPHLCSVCSRLTVTQAQSVCNSDSELYDLCVQKKNGLRAKICSSRAAEQASRNFWIMLEFSKDLQIICHNLGISLSWPKNKSKQGVCQCVRSGG